MLPLPKSGSSVGISFILATTAAPNRALVLSMAAIPARA
jgi:hypothetical protein